MKTKIMLTMIAAISCSAGLHSLCIAAASLTVMPVTQCTTLLTTQEMQLPQTPIT